MMTERTWALDRLNLVGRLLLTSDGTITPMLEQIVGERVVTARLDQSPAPTDPETAALLAASDGRSLLTRATHLVGAVTGTVYVRARSVLAVDAMPPPLRADLLGTDEPIGRLLRRHRVETFREILSLQVPESGFPLKPKRRYLVFTGGVPAMLIDESFAAECFQACPCATCPARPRSRWV
jgi:beta-ribofuranosylaminobenzene 5'-phosphate synthase